MNHFHDFFQTNPKRAFKLRGEEHAEVNRPGQSRGLPGDGMVSFQVNHWSYDLISCLVGGLVGTSILFSHSVGLLIIPIDELIFFRGVAQPPTSCYQLSIVSSLSWQSSRLCILNDIAPERFNDKNYIWHCFEDISGLGEFNFS